MVAITERCFIINAYCGPSLDGGVREYYYGKRVITRNLLAQNSFMRATNYRRLPLYAIATHSGISYKPSYSLLQFVRCEVGRGESNKCAGNLNLRDPEAA